MAQARPRRRRGTENQAIDGLNAMINELIKENRQLRRQVDKLSARATGSTSKAVERALQAIQRRVQKAIASGTPTTGRRRTATAGVSSSRRPTTVRARKPVSPEVAEKRRAALEKARAVRAAKRQAAASE